MNRPAFIAELLEAAGKAAKLKYNVTCDTPEAAPFILLASPANILELASYIEELEAENKKLKELVSSPISDGSRSPEYKQGYAAAWRDSVAWLHAQAKGFNDPNPRARAVLNSAAFQLGNYRKEKGKISDLRRTAALGEKP